MEKGNTIAVDVAQSVFEVAVSQLPGRVAARKRLRRSDLRPFLAQQPRATVLLDTHVRAHGLGRVFVSPLDVVLDRVEALILQPDVVFIATANLALLQGPVMGAPDLVVEVESPGSRQYDRVAKLAVVGVGMRSHAGVATKLFEALAREAINVRMVSTSEIKISVLVDEAALEKGVRTLHAAFGLAA